MISCFLSSFVEFRSAVSEEKSKMLKVNDGQKFEGGKVENVSTNIKAGHN